MATEASGDCAGTITTLRQATVEAGSLGAKDEAALVHKTLSAEQKVTEDKTTDAVAKLDDYQATLDALLVAPKPKIADYDYETLTAYRQLATACLTELTIAAA